MADDENTDESRDYHDNGGCCNDNDGYTGVDHIADNDDIGGRADMDDDDVCCDDDVDAGVDGVVI